MTHLFLSNDLDILAQKLQEITLQSKNAFQIQKILILPNSQIKDWLLQHLMKKKICMGLKFFSLEDFVKSLQDEETFFLETPELFFALLDKIYKNLFPSFLLSEAEKKGDFSKKTLDLCQALAEVFSVYSMYGRPKWDKTELGWQKPIFESLFSPCTPTLYDFLHSGKIPRENLEIHVFHLNEIPPAYLYFLQTLSHKNNLYLYLFSPCKEFWQDQLSDFSMSKLQNSFSFSWEEERNPLLGNWGKLAQKLLYQLEAYPIESTELYEVSREKESLLTQLRNDLLFFSFSSGKKGQVDSSLRIYGVGSSFFKEVEVIYDLVCNLLAQEKALPESILILAPDITPYVPYIHALFSEAPFDYRISEMNILSESHLIQGFFSLLELSKNWDKASFLTLLENPLFCAKHSFTKEEISLVKSWIEEMQIRLGFSLDSSNQHNWEQGLLRLYQSMAFHREESFFMENQELANTEILNRFLPLLYQLHQDLRVLQKGEKKTLPNWALFLEEFLPKYLAISFQEEETFQELFQKILSPLRESPLLTLFNFSTIEYYLTFRLRQKKGKFQATHHKSIHFCSLSSAEIFPADHILVLGMEEGSFPRKDFSSSLNGLSEDRAKNREKDRFLFLQLLFFAKKTLTFTYKNLQEEDQTGVDLCLPLQELLSYLSSFYDIPSDKIHYLVCPLFCDDSGFSGKRDFPSYQLDLYESLRQRETIKPNYVSPPFFPEVEKPEEVSLEKLFSLTKNPFRFYLKEALQISLPRKQEDLDFFLSPLEIYFFRQMLAKNQTREAYLQLQESGKLPCAVFENLARKTLEKEEQAWKEALEAFSIRPEDIQPLLLKEPPLFQEQGWRISPLCFFSQENQLKVEGSVPFCTPEGILCFTEKTPEKLFSLWPYLLLINHPDYQKLSLKPQLLFVKSKSRYSCTFKNPLKAWEKFLQYYLFSCKNPSLFHPLLLESFTKEKSSLYACIEKKLALPKIDPYFTQFFQLFSKDFEEGIWKKYYQEIFEEVL